VLAAVAALGCDAMQGFYIAMPMDAHALQEWMADHVPRVGSGADGATVSG
jgi:EAL domain-containing protein (putative c-di-GMP-specific phosphodiesterase class I)